MEDISPLRHWWARNLKDNLFSAIASPNFIAYNYATLTEEIFEAYRAADVTILDWGVLETALSVDSHRQYVDNVIFDKMVIGH